VRSAAETYDVAIVGGGPAGAAAAIALGRQGKRVLVLEQSLYSETRVGETLPPHAASWLRRLGMSNPFASVPHLSAPGVVQLWDRPVPTAEPLIFEDQRSGWHVDRARFDASLADAAQQAGAVVRRGAAVVSCCLPEADDTWRVQFDCDGCRSDAEAGWVIDATGRRSWLLRHLAIRPRLTDRLVGLLGYGGSRASQDMSLFVEAMPTGWWYSAPLPGQRSVAAFMTDSDLIPRSGRSMLSFWEEQRARSKLIGRLHEPVTAVRTVVARTAWSGTVAGDRWLATGDAAMAFDPLLGRGVCQSLAAGWSCAHALLGSWAGDTKAIGNYQSWCESAYREYMALRSHIYRRVAKWSDAPFWQRRTQ
jgi:flavin-dependent dehydrogenase